MTAVRIPQPKRGDPEYGAAYECQHCGHVMFVHAHAPESTVEVFHACPKRPVGDRVVALKLVEVVR